MFSNSLLSQQVVEGAWLGAGPVFGFERAQRCESDGRVPNFADASLGASGEASRAAGRLGLGGCRDGRGKPGVLAPIQDTRPWPIFAKTALLGMWNFMFGATGPSRWPGAQFLQRSMRGWIPQGALLPFCASLPRRLGATGPCSDARWGVRENETDEL